MLQVSIKIFILLNLIADCMNFAEMPEVGNYRLKTCSTRKIMLEFNSFIQKKKKSFYAKHSKHFVHFRLFFIETVQPVTMSVSGTDEAGVASSVLYQIRP